jgi:hypothetical protein
VSRAAAGYEGYAWGGWGVAEVDCFVGDVAGYGGVCVRDAEEGGGDEVGGGVDEVFRWGGVSIVSKS